MDYDRRKQIAEGRADRIANNWERLRRSPQYQKFVRESEELLMAHIADYWGWSEIWPKH